jgi:hypothetical protein
MATTEQGFGLRTMQGLVEGFDDSKLGAQMFVQNLWEQYAERVAFEGGIAEWDEVTFDRDLGGIRSPGDPSQSLKNADRVHKTQSMVDLRLSTIVEGYKLINQRSPGETGPNAARTLAFEVANLRQKLSRIRERLAIDVLLDTLNISEARYPGSTQIENLTGTYGNNPYAASAPWATVGTKIVSSELPLLSDDYTEASGLQPANIILPSSLEASIRANTEVQAFASSDPASARLFSNTASFGQTSAFLSAMGIGALQWHMIKSGFVPSGGSFTDFLPDSRAIVLPDFSELGNVLLLAEGYGEVPSAAIGSEPGGLVQRAASPGWYSYAVAETDPAAVKIVLGWRGMFIPKQPRAIMVATTTYTLSPRGPPATSRAPRVSHAAPENKPAAWPPIHGERHAYHSRRMGQGRPRSRPDHQRFSGEDAGPRADGLDRPDGADHDAPLLIR